MLSGPSVQSLRATATSAGWGKAALVGIEGGGASGTLTPVVAADADARGGGVGEEGVPMVVLSPYKADLGMRVCFGDSEGGRLGRVWEEEGVGEREGSPMPGGEGVRAEISAMAAPHCWHCLGQKREKGRQRKRKKEKERIGL